MGLIEVKNCPVCGGRERDVSSSMARSKTAGMHYLKHAAAPLGVSVEILVERVQVYRCKSCGTVYCDPWMSPELASSVFCAGAPDHIAGWANFEHWISSSRLNNVQAMNQKLFDLLANKIGAVESYAEFGCPFQGFLLLYQGIEASPQNRIKLFSKALKRDPDVRWTRPTRLYHAVEHWCNRLVVAYHKIRAAKLVSSEARLEARVASLPKRRVLLTQGTTKGWGSNCVRYNGSCQYFAHTVLSADVLPLDEVSRNDSVKFDLIGIFNSIDHTSFPLDVLCSTLKLANYVLVVTHRASLAGKQHLYALSDDFAGWLNQSLDGAQVEDLCSEMNVEENREYNYLLITRRAVL